MSQFPRRVLTSVTVTNDAGRTHTWVKSGSIADIVPGSALESAYGGSSNLSAVITGPSRSPEAAPHLSKEALAN